MREYFFRRDIMKFLLLSASQASDERQHNAQAIWSRVFLTRGALHRNVDILQWYALALGIP